MIKIRRPNIDQKIKLDLYLMRYLAKKLALEYPEMAAINIVGVVDEFGESIFKELNYYNEATNILRFRDIFKDNPRIYIPHVDMKHTTHRMLIMERIFGMSPDDPLQLKAAGLDPVQIALNGAEALLIMVFKEGFSMPTLMRVIYSSCRAIGSPLSTSGWSELSVPGKWIFWPTFPSVSPAGILSAWPTP